LGLRTRPESESVEKVVHWGFVYGDWSSRGLRERTNGFGSGERECGFRERIERFRERCGGDERRRDDEDLHRVPHVHRSPSSCCIESYPYPEYLVL
jgi:hypothetical protein